MKIMIIPTIFIFCFLFSFSSSQPSWLDFCVADFKYPYGPAGYSCKNPLTVNANDFYGSGVLNAPNNFDKNFKAGLSTGYVDQIPGLNGLGVSIARVDYQPGGVAPFHTHTDATEIITVIEGNMTVGFISTNNTVYMKSFAKGDLFVIPRALMHFQINSGTTQLVTIAAYSSSNPNLQFVDEALFSNNFPTPLVTSTTFINSEEVKRLKGIFGGSG